MENSWKVFDKFTEILGPLLQDEVTKYGFLLLLF